MKQRRVENQEVVSIDEWLKENFPKSYSKNVEKDLYSEEDKITKEAIRIADAVVEKVFMTKNISPSSMKK
ncbi:hypothetical protein [Nodosilinea sp. FACHB-13]|uniref:hypothetical protein n=1 Tax=Cyanophyceae TaxID=3028117 RepID=UPI001687865F|nr:hypothetical protein [Nodosilinea sp. FACHB-13]MBD2107283.1 hypothetical protein [Nodosilinea sp. FACHB-13]